MDVGYSEVSRLLLSSVQGFSDSLEFERLDEIERSLPGIVAAAFTVFLVRFQTAELDEGLNSRDAKTLADAYQAIEKLATSSDRRVISLVEDEIFENIRTSESGWDAIEGRLGSRSRVLFTRWRRTNPA